jgi:hypothetical protein
VQHKLAALETQSGSSKRWSTTTSTRREDARRRFEFDPSEVRSDIQFIGLGSAILALLKERSSIEDDLAYRRAQLDQIDG